MNTPTNSDALHPTYGYPTDYDAGLLNDFGGGDVGWWHDYLRAEIGRANDYWREILEERDDLDHAERLEKLISLPNAKAES